MESNDLIPQLRHAMNLLDRKNRSAESERLRLTNLISSYDLAAVESSLESNVDRLSQVVSSIRARTELVGLLEDVVGSAIDLDSFRSRLTESIRGLDRNLRVVEMPNSRRRGRVEVLGEFEEILEVIS